MKVLVALVRASAEAQVEERTIEVEQIPARGEMIGFLMPEPTWFQVTQVRRSFSDPGEVLGISTEIQTLVHAVQL